LEEKKKKENKEEAAKQMSKVTKSLFKQTTYKFGTIISKGNRVSANDLSVLPEHLKNVYSGVIMEEGE